MEEQTEELKDEEKRLNKKLDEISMEKRRMDTTIIKLEKQK